MQAREAAGRLEITQRMLRHYEKAGLMKVHRSENGYRIYSEADLRRAGRIRDFIATGFSTREIRSMVACLSDDGAGPCEGGIEQLQQKLGHIDRLRTDLDARREAVLDRLTMLKRALSTRLEGSEVHRVASGIPLPEDSPRGRHPVPARVGSNAARR